MRRFRHKATSGEWERIIAAKFGVCRGCGEHKPVTFHHLVPRSLGGDDVPDNILPLCGHGTAGCHGKIEDHSNGWRETAARIRSSLTPAELNYAIATKGEYWLSRYYPEAQ